MPMMTAEAIEALSVGAELAGRDKERKRCVNITRFAEGHATTQVGQGVAQAIREAIENDAIDRKE